MHYLLLCLLVLLHTEVLCGGVYPKGYFSPPLSIPLEVSGTFGELRHHHFHTGVDFTTQGTTGIPVKASAEGYVSRIKVSPTGYGHAIYIDHPNGYTTVYGHLSTFASPIAQYVSAVQHRLKSWAVDIYPEAGALPVTQREVIGLSGNSGSSGGPHLHFEIRHTTSEVPVNPLLFGWDIKDATAPHVESLMIYQKNNGQPQPNRKTIPLRGGNGRFTLAQRGDTIRVSSPRVAVGAYTWDRGSSHHRRGIYRLTIRKEKQTIFQFTAEKVPFHDSRFVNSHIDYCYEAATNRDIHKGYVAPGNFLKMYDTVVNEGWIKLTPGVATPVTLQASDFKGNTSTVRFWLKFSPKETGFKKQQVDWTFPGKGFYFEDSLFRLTIPPWSLYDTTAIACRQVSAQPLVYAAAEACTPLHYGAEVALFAAHISPKTRPKTLLRVKAMGQEHFFTGYWKDDWFYAHSKYLGTFDVAVDTEPPAVVLFNAPAPGEMIRIRIRDMHSGIARYDATVNGTWIPLAYDAKRGLLTGRIPEYSGDGKQIFTLVVEDEVGNIAQLQRTL